MSSWPWPGLFACVPAERSTRQAQGWHLRGRVHETPVRTQPVEVAWQRGGWKQLGGLDSAKQPQVGDVQLGTGSSWEPKEGKWEAETLWDLKEYGAEMEEGCRRFQKVRSQEDGGVAVGPMATGVFDLRQCSPSSIARKMSSKGKYMLVLNELSLAIILCFCPFSHMMES